MEGAIRVRSMSGLNTVGKYVYLYFAGQANVGGLEESTAATSVVPLPEVTPGLVIFGFLGLVVAGSSWRA